MRLHYIILSLSVILFAGNSITNADMVILKSGEMFKTREAWKENGIVSFYQNGRVVRVDEREVERLVNSSPEKKKNPTSKRSAVAKIFTPPVRSAIDPPLYQPSMSGDTVGYLDLKWGVQLSQVEGLSPAGTDPDYGGVQLYTTKDSHRFGRAQVDRIIYGFWQGKLYTITVWTSNFLDFKDLKADAFRRYGKGFQNRVDVEKFYWSDDTTDRLLSYDYDTGFLWMRSREIHEMVRARYPD